MIGPGKPEARSATHTRRCGSDIEGPRHYLTSYANLYSAVRNRIYVLPLEHFIFPLLPLVVYTVVRYRKLPTGNTVLLVLIASQLPDVIDKPLAWMFGLLPSGRMFAHSIVVSGPVLIVGCALAIRRGWGRPSVVFTLTYLSHLVGDFYPILWQGSDYYFFPNLFWPLLEANPDPNPSFAAHLAGVVTALVLAIGVVVVSACYIVVTFLWNSQARPEDN